MGKIQIDENVILNWEEAKKHLRARLQNVKARPEPEVFRSATEYMLDDLVIVPYVKMNAETESVWVYISLRLLEHWNQSPRHVIELAMTNTKEECQMQGMADLFRVINPQAPEAAVELLEDEAPKMMICSNAERDHGAIAGILMREELLELFGTGYTLIPSSVHEMIAVNRDAYAEATKMVQEVNEATLQPHERLSDHAYRIW